MTKLASVMSFSEALKRIEDLISYVQHQDNSSEPEVMLLRRLKKNMAFKKRVQCVQLVKLTNFVKTDVGVSLFTVSSLI